MEDPAEEAAPDRDARDGDRPIARRLIRNNEYVYTASPGRQTVEVLSRPKPKKGLNYYYLRVLQRTRGCPGSPIG
jgi:hypothetical protein